MTNKRDKITALLLTLLVAALTSLTLVFTGMPSAAARPEPPQPQEIFYEVIEFPEEEVIITDEVAPADQSSGLDVADAGKADQAPAPVVAKQPQPDNAKAAPQEPKPSGADKAEESAAKRKPRANLPTGKDFNAEADANATQNSSGNDPYAIAGRGIVRKPHTVIRTKSAQSGWVDVDITVTPQGKVTRAEVVGSSGFGNEEEEIRTKAKALLLSELEYSADASQPTRTYTKRVRISPK